MFSHILKLDDHTFLLTICNDAEFVYGSYVFSTQADAESAAEFATGMFERPEPKDLTYDDLLAQLSAKIDELKAQGY